MQLVKLGWMSGLGQDGDVLRLLVFCPRCEMSYHTVLLSALFASVNRFPFPFLFISSYPHFHFHGIMHCGFYVLLCLSSFRRKYVCRTVLVIPSIRLMAHWRGV